MRGAFESAQGLVPARRVRHRHRQAGGHMQEIVCKVLFLKLEGQEKKEKKVSTGGSITDEKNMQKTKGFLTILTTIVNFTSAPRTVSRQPVDSQSTVSW